MFFVLRVLGVTLGVLALVGCPVGRSVSESSTSQADALEDSQQADATSVDKLLGEWRGSCWQVAPGSPWESGLDARRRLAKSDASGSGISESRSRPPQPVPPERLNELRRIDMLVRVEPQHLAMPKLQVAIVALEVHVPGEQSGELRDVAFRLTTSDDGVLQLEQSTGNRFQIEKIDKDTMTLSGKMNGIGGVTLGSGKITIDLQKSKPSP